MGDTIHPQTHKQNVNIEKSNKIRRIIYESDDIETNEEIWKMTQKKTNVKER